VSRCTVCGAGFPPVAAALGVCAACARSGRAAVDAHVRAVHRRSRQAFGLPAVPPRAADGVRCVLCMNRCRIGRGERGYCGLRQNVGGRLVGGRPGEGRLSWYYDPLPTNCVADWVCAGGTSAGYPAFARRRGPEVGFANLAVFYEACSFNCLFCQNWHFRQGAPGGRETTARDLAARADGRTTCVCFFGGDPSPQMVHSIQAARLARRRAEGGILRICWETNGSMHPRLLDRALDLALESGGCIKFDLKAWDEALHRALTGASNAWTVRNFARAATRFRERPVPPLLVASTLLVPGYVDAAEVGRIARFVAEQDAEIPYCLLAFHPCFLLEDLPTTSRREALAAAEAARAAGLRCVRIGNEHLLRDEACAEQGGPTAAPGL